MSADSAWTAGSHRGRLRHVARTTAPLSEPDFCLVQLADWITEGLVLGSDHGDRHLLDYFRRSRDASFGRRDECLVAACLMLRNPTLDPWELMHLFLTCTKRTQYFLSHREIWESVERVGPALLAVGHLNDEERRKFVDEAVFSGGVRVPMPT